MVAKEKACRKCRKVFEGAKCPDCGSEEANEGFKGKIVVLKPEESEIAKNIKITGKGTFAIKVK